MENKKKTVLILAIIVGLLLTGLLSYLNAKYINPSDYKVRNITVSDSHLPESFDGFTVMFISDLEYGTYFTKDRLERFIDKINSCEADVVIFGGDLFDKDYNPVSNDITALRTALKSIEAPKGKFAILGDFDYVTEQRSALVRKLLYDAEYELLQDNNITLHNATSETINLIGFNYTEGTLVTDQAFATITLTGLFAALTLSKPLNALLLGEQYAENLGINIQRVRNSLLLITGILSAVTTAFCGPIAFIGLAVPHVARMLLVTDNHHYLMPATILTGAAIALLCNIICVLPGSLGIIPLNAVTPIMGAPVIIYVIMKQRNK